MNILQSAIDPFGYTGMPFLRVCEDTYAEEMDVLAEYIIRLRNYDYGKVNKSTLLAMLRKLFDDVRKFNSKLAPEFIEDALMNYGARGCSVRRKESSLDMTYFTDFTWTQPDGSIGRYRYVSMIEK